MKLKIVKTKKELPLDNYNICSICLENIDIDEILEEVPNCIICNNGHISHNNCFRRCIKHECPLCKDINIKFCKSIFGYSYFSKT